MVSSKSKFLKQALNGTEMRLFYIYALLVILNILIFSLLYAFFPSLRPHLIKEDYFLENLTALLFFASFVVGLLIVFISKRRSKKKAYMPIPLIALLCFLEEVNYGMRFFNIDMPRVEGIEFDAVHDIVAITFKILIDTASYFLYAAILAAIIVVVFLVIRYRDYLGKAARVLQRYPAYKMVLIFIAFMTAASLIDLYVIELISERKMIVWEIDGALLITPGRYRVLYFVEELLEMNGALALLFASISTLGKSPPSWRGTRVSG